MGEDVLPILFDGTERESRRRDSPVQQAVANRLKQASPSPDRLRSLRALQALEMMEGEQSRKLLIALAAGAPKVNLTVEAKATLARMAPRFPKAPDATVEVLWKELSNEDAPAAFTAIRELAARPRASVPFLAKKLLALAKEPDDEEEVRRLIDDLGDEEFSRREKASKALQRKGPAVVLPLREALEKSKDAEQKQRIGTILAALNKSALSGGRLHADRALEVLHAADTEEANQTLAKLAKGAKPRWLREAAAALVRPAR